MPTSPARVSTTRETVARVLNDLARKRIVLRESGALVILDVAPPVGDGRGVPGRLAGTP